MHTFSVYKEEIIGVVSATLSMRRHHDVYYSRESIIILLTTSLSEGSVLPMIIDTMQQHELWADHPSTYPALRGAILLINHKVTAKPLTFWLRVKFLLGGSICKQLDNSTTSLTDEKHPISSPDSIKVVSILWKTIFQASTCSVFKHRFWKPTSNKACICSLILFYSHTEDLK